ncbi:DNA cytosine methyltransferase [Aneurinibacillus aneurinilyticus]|uniref:DNA (cytosine-5-)-methyltransferase n=1 Tax=Aneurinibacillus aneurinilyticus ATCC 12856 TaxID=649747 RepID=U1YDS3_ANEAE|nr:DNA cytosine methyltransferase [Aneurinibacillus aneurinilyticus]ERI10242.1 DNA (cytosine-5-)-methyltransferase [Aneurinibacillus aneurinilyticus ATCC 12856]MED0705870.1 DNA cytosine methyltransferase [Aneurinibacillus aneurinilyticus]MED0722741.1 DNA cytosine methyltransferase [Aneurinibacillus aneurinilyticus]MED0731425.1 DNA cytosine methyltransferase [Aneurinibacillus aneurinilyticus]MED0740181.1 DNA cytosine methyltransferase [Aneurinibacillus aneurinilyticus]
MPEWLWSLKDLHDIPKNGLKVFSCFSCGGGSTMGYKLAGYEIIGNVEIDPQMMSLYRQNHNPKHPFLMPIQEFKLIPDNELPKELFELDILDGSPPCSVFSTSGKREEKWGAAHKFREGQAIQHLDDLFFDFLDVAEKLKPKVIIAENVKGLIIGTAKGFVKMIKDHFEKIGYQVQLFLLNSAAMGVPQKRERVFFIAFRKDLRLPKLQLSFNERPILYKEIRTGRGRPLSTDSLTYQRWLKRRPKDDNLGDITSRIEGKVKSFNSILVKDNKVLNTIASSSCFIRYDEPYFISDEDIIRSQTFPQDYNFLNADVQYVCGMSVPPVMMRKISSEVYKQWFTRIQ